jgi:hypothetical protein
VVSSWFSGRDCGYDVEPSGELPWKVLGDLIYPMDGPALFHASLH